MLDWRRKSATEVRTTIRSVLDADLPADPYPPDLFNTKVQAVFDHIVSAYGDDGSSLYRPYEPAAGVAPADEAVLTALDLDIITEGVVERIRVDAEFAAKVAEQLGLAGGAALRTVAEIIDNDHGRE